ncbi:AraC family transcriptional regulator [Pseudomonas sp. GCM10022186]|uniref:AraC-like transcriptional regulator QhpR n=1 Tax=Pseudomonas sp. GCM10022186 TaxID=3252650 RepID=UPI00360AB6B5
MTTSPVNASHPELLFSRFADILSPYLTEAGLDSSFFSDPEIQCPQACVVKLLELAGNALGEPIGLRIGSQMRTADFGVVGQATRSMDRLSDAIDGLCRYMVVRSQAEKLDVNEEDGLVVISYQVTDTTITQRRQDAELSISALLSCFREVTGSPLAPTRVDFEHAPPKDLALHREIFRCPIFFNQDCNRLYFSKVILDLPILTANKRLLQALQPFLEEQRKRLSQPANLLADVSQAIAIELRRGRVGVAQVSESLNMSVRTLQRRLSELDLEFGTLVEDVRRALALEYVSNSNDRLTDIALMLGYNEASSFTRAFRRWTGLTPREYRKKAI